MLRAVRKADLATQTLRWIVSVVRIILCTSDVCLKKTNKGTRRKMLDGCRFEFSCTCYTRARACPDGCCGRFGIRSPKSQEVVTMTTVAVICLPIAISLTAQSCEWDLKSMGALSRALCRDTTVPKFVRAPDRQSPGSSAYLSKRNLSLERTDDNYEGCQCAPNCIVIFILHLA